MRGRHLRTISGGVIAAALIATGSVFPTAGVEASGPWRINSGGGNHTDVDGNLFVADKAFVAGDFGFQGGDARIFDPIAGTPDAPLFESLRASLSRFNYLFDNVATGPYEVHLHFIDVTAGGAGGRGPNVFDVVIEDVQVLTDYDVFVAAGGPVPVTETISVHVSDGQLAIGFFETAGQAFVSAIEVVPVVPAGVDPNIALFPPHVVDFGEVAVGAAGERTVAVQNLGNADLEVLDLGTPANSAFYIASATTTPFTIAPGGFEPVTYGFAPTVAGHQVTVMEIRSNDPDQGTLELILSGVTASTTPFLINAGGADYTDVNGNEFVGDRPYTSGGFGHVGGGTRTTGPVAGTVDDRLYSTLRGSRTSFSYLFDVPNGYYDITLYFTERSMTAAGQRQFDVIVEGVIALDNYDIFAASGGQLVAITETVSALVQDGQLNLDFVNELEGALVSAVQLTLTPTYVDVAAQAGLVLSHELGTICGGPPIGSGSAWADYDGDGLIDLFITDRGGANHLYHNEGDTNADGVPDFIDVAAALGVDDPTGAGLSAVFIDYNNDGDQDLYVTNWGGNTLYENQLADTGIVGFVDVTAFAGLVDGGRGITTAWGDFDGDSFLDVYITRHGECATKGGGPDPQNSEDNLYHNNGDGTFTNRNEWMCGGLSTCEELSGAGFSPGWFDYDGDGDSDLYLVNDIVWGNRGNVLWQNDGPDGLGGWTFTDVSLASGTDVEANGMGLGIGDYNNDGHLDIAFSNIGKGDRYLLRNLGDLTFETSTAPGISGDDDDLVTWGTAFFDHDNDAWLDLLFVSGQISGGGQPNIFYVNNADGTFTNFSHSSGLDDPGKARDASIVDFDQDGYVDVYVGNYGEGPKLFHNRSVERGNANHWLTVTVEGTVSNRDGIGTRLTLTTLDGITQMREITSGPTHGGGDYKAAYFGLGGNATGDLTVRWPTGVIENVGVVLADQLLHIVEGP